MFTHHRPINPQNRWLLINTKAAVVTLDLNDFRPVGNSRFQNYPTLYKNDLRSECHILFHNIPAKNSKRKQTREILNPPLNIFMYNDEY